MSTTKRPRVNFSASLFAAAWVMLACPTGLRADEPKPADTAGVEFFEKNVRPILVKQCYSCHSHAGGKMRGGLALDSRSGWEKGGDSGPAVVPGKPDKSLLIQAVKHASADTKMPPKEKLSAAEIDTLTEWVRRGAPDPRVLAKSAVAEDWWSLKPLVKPAVPGKNPGHPIDAFVRAKLREKQLTPATRSACHGQATLRHALPLWGADGGFQSTVCSIGGAGKGLQQGAIMRAATFWLVLCGLWLLPTASVRADEVEEKAAKRIEDRGGRVVREGGPRGPVTHIDLFTSSDKVASIRDLSGFPRLTSLNLTGTDITDAEVELVSGLKTLSSLDLRQTRVTDAGLAHIAKLKNLSHLCLMSTRVTDDGLKHLAGLARLTYLDLSFSQEVSGFGLKHLAGLKTLTTLRLGGQAVTDLGLESVGTLHSLTTLHLNCSKVTDRGLAHLTGLNGLTDLTLFGCDGLTDAGMVTVARLKALKSLALHGRTPVTDVGLKELTGLTNLTLLHLAGTKVTDDGLKHLAGLNSLVTLHLSETQITGTGLKHLAGLEKLATLTLGGPLVTDVGLKHLAGLKTLTEIGLFQTKATDAGLMELVKLDRLRTLRLSSNGFTDAGVKAFREARPDCRVFK